MEAGEIYGRMTLQYGGYCLRQGKVYEWVERYNEKLLWSVDDMLYGWTLTRRSISVSSITVELATMEFLLI
jgi:hypothetical protein